MKPSAKCSSRAQPSGLSRTTKPGRLDLSQLTAKTSDSTEAQPVSSARLKQLREKRALERAEALPQGSAVDRISAMESLWETMKANKPATSELAR